MCFEGGVIGSILTGYCHCLHIPVGAALQRKSCEIATAFKHSVLLNAVLGQAAAKIATFAKASHGLVQSCCRLSNGIVYISEQCLCARCYQDRRIDHLMSLLLLVTCDEGLGAQCRHWGG